LSLGFAGAPAKAESRSATKKSLYGLQTHSGYSELSKLEARRKERALLGTRTLSVSMTGLTAVALEGSGHPGAFGKVPPLAASQSGGGELWVPVSSPV
jgi:hypothetical protein